MNSDEEYVKGLQQLQQPGHPRLRLDNVFDEEVVAGDRKCRQAAMEPFEERRPHV